MASRLELAVRNTDHAVPLEPGQSVTAGRTPQCDVQLDDSSVSRRHCRIAFAAGRLEVKDLDSANGTHFDPAIAAAAVRLFDRGELNVHAMALEIRTVERARGGA